MHNYAAGRQRPRTHALESHWGAAPVEQKWQRTGIASSNKFHTPSVSQHSISEKGCISFGPRTGRQLSGGRVADFQLEGDRGLDVHVSNVRDHVRRLNVRAAHRCRYRQGSGAGREWAGSQLQARSCRPWLDKMAQRTAAAHRRQRHGTAPAAASAPTGL